MAGKPLSAMTAKELLRYQLDDAQFQLEQVLAGLDGSHVDGKPVNTGMSMREMVVHLAEAYTATIKEAKGEKHEWGTFELPHESWQELVDTAFALRAEAVEAALSVEDEEKGMKNAHAFLVGHDYYHVGQLATIRIATDSDWNSYSIYR
jgi:uncharacterized damage-inducible protein DinB